MKWIVGVAAVVALVLYLFVFDVWTVPGDDPALVAAMAPTLAPGDVVLVTKSVSTGDGYLLRCADPQVPGRYVVTRQAGKTGSTVAVEGRDLVKIDGTSTPSLTCDPAKVTVEDPVTHAQTDLDCFRTDTGGISYQYLRGLGGDVAETTTSVVPANKVFGISDDRHFHLDSRDFGLLDPQTCQHLVFRLWGGATAERSRRFVLLW